MKAAGVALLAALISIGAGFGLSQYLSSARTGEAKPTAIGSAGPEFRLPDTGGEFREHTDWPDKLLLINFWATWCGPCRKEMPDLMALRERYAGQVEVVGIAIDRPDVVVEFVQELGIAYPILIGDGSAMAMMREYGNPAGALPFTLLTDRDYQVFHAVLGPVDATELGRQIDRQLQPLLP